MSDETKLPTLGEFGKNLPIGFTEDGGPLLKTFELREWNWDLEETIGQALEDLEDVNVMHHVSGVTAECVKSIGTIDFDKLNSIQRRGLISRILFPDVLMMYVWIRIEGMGSVVRFNPFKCGKCRKQIDFAGDLKEMEVQEVDPENMTRTVELQKGVKYADSQRKKITVGPLHWSFFESDEFISAMSNQAKLKRLTLQHGVVEIEGAPKPVHMTTEHLKTMDPKEIVKLVREIDQCAGGVAMNIEDKCPHCRTAFEQELDWRYGDFFGRSVP